MSLSACGVAFVDRSGAVVVEDRSFRSRLGLSGEDATAALRALAGEEPALARLLAGEGPTTVPLSRAGRAPLEVERIPTPEGALLVLREPESEERDEHAIRSRVLGAVVAGVAHDIKNPLNAMALQAALLAEKLSRAPGAADADRHLGTLREQILRVDEVVRRLVDVTEPAALGFADLGALTSDAAGLLGHEARSRGIALEVAAPRLVALARCEPGRLSRLVLGLLGCTLEAAPDGGRVSVRVDAEAGEARLWIHRTAGARDAALRHACEVVADAAGALGGTLDRAADGDGERISLGLPGASP